jgi:hypothetical protein
MSSPFVRGLLSLAIALAAMYGVVLCVLAAATRHLLWAVPALACLAVAGYACSRLYSTLFARR